MSLVNHDVLLFNTNLKNGKWWQILGSKAIWILYFAKKLKINWMCNFGFEGVL
jgi:hypothetical protein